MTDIDRKRFLNLLRSGMWNVRPDLRLFADGKTDWNYIFMMSGRHSVVGWVYDGMEMLPDGMKPPRRLVMEWYTVVVRIENMNRRLNDGISGLAGIYGGRGIDFILLKGQGVASAYPNPMHRQPGDIDVYVGRENYRAANTALEEDGGIASHKESLNDKHRHFKWKGLIVENHRDIVRLSTKSYSKAWNAFVERHLHEGNRELEIGKSEVKLPSDYFNSVYLLLHILQHLMSSGIGLRQVCDWMTVVKRGYGDFARDEWMHDIKSLGMERPFELFSYIAVELFGLEKEMFPFYDENCREPALMLADDIIAGGNFGKEWSDERPVTGPRIKRNFVLLSWVLRRYRKVRKIYPVEAWNHTLVTIKNGILRNIGRIFQKS